MFEKFKKFVIGEKEKPIEVKPKFRIAKKIIELKVYAEEGVVEKIIRQGIKMGEIDPYDGLDASDIKERGERVYQVSDNVYDYRFEQLDNKLNLYIQDYEGKEYFVCDVSNYPNMKYYLKNKDNFDVDIDVKYGGGKYKYPCGNTVETDDIPPYIYVSIAMYEKEG